MSEGKIRDERFPHRGHYDFTDWMWVGHKQGILLTVMWHNVWAYMAKIPQHVTKGRDDDERVARAVLEALVKG